MFSIEGCLLYTSKEMSITVPSWLTVDVEKLEGKVVAMPRREDIDTPVAEHLIVELYSK